MATNLLQDWLCPSVLRDIVAWLILFIKKKAVLLNLHWLYLLSVRHSKVNVIFIPFMMKTPHNLTILNGIAKYPHLENLMSHSFTKVLEFNICL